jgi:uncharacterized protein YjbJ (UPF0337 family)
LLGRWRISSWTEGDQPFATAYQERFVMNWDQIQARWKQLKGRAKQRWGKLTHNAQTTIAGKRERIEGKREQLAGKLQEKYVHDKALSDKELEDFTKSLEPKDTAPSV